MSDRQKAPHISDCSRFSRSVSKPLVPPRCFSGLIWDMDSVRSEKLYVNGPGKNLIFANWGGFFFFFLCAWSCCLIYLVPREKSRPGSDFICEIRIKLNLISSAESAVS